MNKIKIVFFEDESNDYKKYIKIIHETFEKIKKDYNYLDIEVIQIIDNYSDIKKLISEYLQCSPNSKTSFRKILESFNLFDKDIIYFLDEKWGNTIDAGSTFFSSYLHDENCDNSANAIIITHYSASPKHDGMQYIQKSDAIKDTKSLRNKITSTNVFKEIQQKFEKKQKASVKNKKIKDTSLKEIFPNKEDPKYEKIK